MENMIKNKGQILKWSSLIGYVFLSSSVVLLLATTVYQAQKSHSVGGIFTLIVLLGALVAIYREGKSLLESTANPTQLAYRTIFLEFLAVVAGGLSAYVFSQDISLGPVVAASLVAVIAHLVFPKYGVPAYCGAFVGMTSEILLYNHIEVMIASLIAGMVFILTRRVFSGAGGKLGTIALIGTTFTGVGLSRAFLSTPISDWKTNSIVIIIALIAAPLTYFFNHHKDNGPVLASGMVGLVGGLILPALFSINGETYAVVAICASFTGMTSNNRCPNFWHMLSAGLFTGVIFVFSTPLLGGAGGKLGTIAFGSVLSACGYSYIIQWLIKKNGDKKPVSHT